VTNSRAEAALLRGWYSGERWVWLLRPLEFVYRCTTALRRWGYRAGLYPVYRAPAPVVIVGNITVGGTGKTPIVIALVEALQARGLRPGVVSRGYGATGGTFPHRVTAHSQAIDCGDEPLLIFHRTGAPCMVDPNRPAAVRALLADEKVDIVLCDDGLQHYALARDFEIVVLDAQRGVGNGFCLPAGPLREPVARLAGVNAVLWRGGDSSHNSVAYVVDGLVPLRPDALCEAPATETEVQAVAGIGQPEQFFTTLAGLGYRVTPHSFPDHYRYTQADFDALSDGPLIMTEKDAVKCASFARKNDWYLKISARLPDALVDRIAALVI
jgi:tetraacyldisaccharide 4'-kinase